MAYENNLNLDKFLYSIDKMLESKYILIDRRISDILLSIADTNAVYNLIAECMINFDFAYEWKKSSGGNYLKFPETDSKKISYIFCLLNNIDDRNLDVTQILERYFSYDRAHSPYELFCRYVIVEFRRLILEGLGVIPAQEEAYGENDDIMPQVTNDFDMLISKIRQLSADIGMSKKFKKSYMSKEDTIAVLSTFEQVVTNKQVEYFYAFAVIIKGSLGEVREYKKAALEIFNLAEKLLMNKN